MDFKNTGNVHFKSQGIIEVYNWGRKVATLEMPAQNILPGATREIVTSWASGLGIGPHKAIAKAVIDFGDQNKTNVEKETTFVVIPVASIILILLGIIALIALVWFFAGFYPKKLKAKILAEQKSIVTPAPITPQAPQAPTVPPASEPLSSVEPPQEQV